MARRNASRRLPAALAAVCCAAALFWAADAAAAAGGRIPITRAITLAPHITELVFAAGAGDRIVGTVDSSDYPPAARAIPRIGDGVSVSVEQALALTPQAVIAWLPSGATRTLGPALERMHIPLLYSQPLKLDDIPAEIIRYGRLFGTQQTAAAAAHALAGRIAGLRREYAGRPSVPVFIEVGSAPLYTIGRDPLLNDVLAACGGVNIYAGLPMPAARVSPESVLLENPRAIIGPGGGPSRREEILSRWAALRLPAALRGHVYAIDPDALFRPGPRLVEAAETLCRDLDQAR